MRQAFASSALPPVHRAVAGQLPAAQASPLEPLGAYLGGETITLLRLATIAARYGMQVIYLDLKGSQKTAAEFVAAMRYAGIRRIKVFPHEACDGWRGDANAISNRLMALADTGIHA